MKEMKDTNENEEINSDLDSNLGANSGINEKLDVSLDNSKDLDESENNDEENNDENENLKKDMGENEISEAEKISVLNHQIEIHKEKLLRIAAEYENYRRRSEQEKIQIFSNATESAILKLLPVIDSLEMAFNSFNSNDEAFIKGVNMVKSQLETSLKKMDVSTFGEIGDEFTPEFHSAISHIEKEGEEKNVIVQIFQKGYKYKEKVIRHATVQVAN